jgi:two-component sensor histidine kinase
LKLLLQAAVPLGMAINELCTNAVKYGALSTPGGRIKITAEADETQNQFSWDARAGRSACPPPRAPGLWHPPDPATSLINSTVRLSFDPPGVVCEIDVPVVAISAPPSD